MKNYNYTFEHFFFIIFIVNLSTVLIDQSLYSGDTKIKVFLIIGSSYVFYKILKTPKHIKNRKEIQEIDFLGFVALLINLIIGGSTIVLW